MMSWFRNKIKVTGEWMDWWDVVEIIRPYNTDPTPHKVLRYLLPGDYSIRKLLKEFQVSKDVPCHAVMDIFRGRIAEAELYHVFVPTVRIKKPEWEKSHSCAGFIQDRQIIFGEPQTRLCPAYSGANIEWIQP